MTFPTTGILDDFARADQTPLGGIWSRGWSSYDWSVVSQQAKGGSTGNYCTAYISGGTYGPDTEIYATVATLVNGDDNIDLYLRTINPTSSGTLDGYVLRLQWASSTVILKVIRMDDGSETQLGATFYTSPAPSANDKVGFCITGDGLEAFWKYGASAWASQLTRTDATYSAAGYIEIQTYADTTLPVIDDFGGGTVVSSAPKLSDGFFPDHFFSVWWPVDYFQEEAEAPLIEAATETDLAQAVGRIKSSLIGQALEAELAQAVGRIKGKLIGQVTETDLAQPVTAPGIITIAVGQAFEVDTSQSVAWAPKRRMVAQAAEVDDAQAVGRTKTAPIGLASETDLAQAVGRIKAMAIGQAVETDLAQIVTRALAGGHIIPVGQALESDLAQPIVVVLSGGPPYLPPVHWVEPVLIPVDWLRIEEEELAVLIS